MKKSIQLTPMGTIPTKNWEDLLDVIEQQTYATVYTLKYARKDSSMPKKPGITKRDDGIYDIIIDKPELTKPNIRTALKELTKITGIEYRI